MIVIDGQKKEKKRDAEAFLRSPEEMIVIDMRAKKKKKKKKKRDAETFF